MNITPRDVAPPKPSRRAVSIFCRQPNWLAPASGPVFDEEHAHHRLDIVGSRRSLPLSLLLGSRIVTVGNPVEHSNGEFRGRCKRSLPGQRQTARPAIALSTIPDVPGSPAACIHRQVQSGAPRFRVLGTLWLAALTPNSLDLLDKLRCQLAPRLHPSLASLLFHLTSLRSGKRDATRLLACICRRLRRSYVDDRITSLILRYVPQRLRPHLPRFADMKAMT